MNLLNISIFLLAGVIFIAACNNPNQVTNTVNNTTASASPASSQPTTPVDELAAATELYAKNCMICHRDSGKGGKVTIEGKSLKPEDLTSEKMKAKSDDKLLGQIGDGAPDDGMPAFKGKLTDDEIKSIILHIRELQSK